MPPDATSTHARVGAEHARASEQPGRIPDGKRLGADRRNDRDTATRPEPSLLERPRETEYELPKIACGDLAPAINDDDPVGIVEPVREDPLDE